MDTMYKLPLDNDIDKDIIDFIGSISRNKKAEVIRHALRFYFNLVKNREEGYFLMSPLSKEQRLELDKTSSVHKKVKDAFSIEKTNTNGLEDVIVILDANKILQLDWEFFDLPEGCSQRSRIVFDGKLIENIREGLEVTTGFEE